MAIKEYKMSVEQYDELIAACQPVPYLIIGGQEPTSPQENANRAWVKLGRDLGFEPMTVKPVAGKDAHYFTAEAIEEEEV